MDLGGFLQNSQRVVNDVVRTLRTNPSKEQVDVSYVRLDALSRNLNRMAATFPQCVELLPDVEGIMDLITSQKLSQQSSAMKPSLERGHVGRPRFDISLDQLEIFLNAQFSNREIAETLNVSGSVVKRRLRHFGLSRRDKFSVMTDDELDVHVRRLTEGNPLLGQRNVLGLLASEGHILQRDRVAASLARVDAAAVAIRWSRTIQRRSYKVAGPNALWHIDGNHKLIRWGFVIHGGMDGYSRVIVFLNVSTNNRAETVFDAFVEGTAEFGIPSRVRCDRGGENVAVATFMNVQRGIDRGSCITGKSVHNQRIERFWRDMYTGCTYTFKQLFEEMESSGLLDPDCPIQVWCLHFIFLPRISAALHRFAKGWNNHRLSSEGGKTPLKLYIQGAVKSRGTGQTAIDSLFYEPPATDEQLPEDFGIDWDGPVPHARADTSVSDQLCPVSVDQLQTLKDTIDPMSRSDNLGVDLYQRALEFCRNLSP